MPKSRIALAVMACSVIAGPTLGAPSPYDGAYSGERFQADDSTNGGTSSCVVGRDYTAVTTGSTLNSERRDVPIMFDPGRENVTATITGNTLKFTDSKWRDIPIRFNPGSDGTFGGTFGDPAGCVVDVRGKATGTALDADVLNYGDGCEYHWHLEKNR